jgi:hypothetical protein
MIQLYFLSIICNGLSGYILFAGDEDVSFEKNSRFLNNPVFHLVLGIISTVTGILKLLSPTMDGIPILGDLLPVAAGITSGLLLIFGIYRQETSSTAVTETTGTLDRLGLSLLRFRKSVGLGLIVVAIVHFLFPKALFL